jgi:pimeloyl-ACP methyl ester carboxylesterase
MNNYTESIESDKLAVATTIGLYRPGPFWRFWMLALFLISMWFFLITAFAQTGLPLNFSPLSNPLPAPQSYYLDSDPNIPLADKTPLILIHGIDLFSGTPSASASGWDNFCIWYYSTPSIKNRFKIYRFAYQSNQNSVQTLGNYLAQLLNANDGSATDQQLAAKDIVILSYSMGGLVARRLMEEQRQTKATKWNQSVLRLVTLATPHHGTPAANRCDYVLDPLPDYIGALGYKLGHELGTVDFAALAAGLSLGNGIFHAIPTYNQPNRLDLLWDNYDGFFTSGFSPDELNPPTATLNSISSAQSYDSKIVAYAGNIANGSIIHSGHDGYLSGLADILANGLGIPSDGIVPIASAWFQDRLGDSQIRFFDDYDHYQMMQSKTPPGDLPSPSDPLFTTIGNDLTATLPIVTPPTITSVSPATLSPSSSPQTITITGSNFQPSGANASTLVFYDPANNSYKYKCQSSLLTLPGRVGKGCPCRASCALNIPGQCTTS